nr:hypothetical protein [Marinicella sp. W31]MDC2878941.1 hypothetical protein [Marinicella sp. W31]
MSNDPTHQFQIHNIVPINVGGLDLSFTNASLFMAVTVGIAAGFMYLATSKRGLIPRARSRSPSCFTNLSLQC